MNIFLVPHTWARHIAPALVQGAAALLVWWFFLVVEVAILPVIGLLIRPEVEGPLLLGTVAGVIAGTSLLVEGSLRRQALVWRAAYVGAAFLATFILCAATYAAIQLVEVYSAPYVGNKDMLPLLDDAGYTSLRYRILQWLFCGFWAGLVPLVIRIVGGWWFNKKLRIKVDEIFDHIGGGLAAAGAGAAFWHVTNFYGQSLFVLKLLGISADLYLSTAIGFFLWGAIYGLLVWGVPSDLYAGWVRVLSAHRFGHRIPVDRADPNAPSERFAGHYPRGLDLFLPAERGVAELHVSFVTDGKQNYSVRGLSQQPIVVKRLLERVDLRYDPRRPSPLETELSMEDVVILGQGAQTTEMEFILLPREER